MNRKERRAAVMRGKATADVALAGIPDLMAAANRAYQQGQLTQAEIICRQILKHAPMDEQCLNLLGLINQAFGRHRQALKLFAKSIASNGLEPAAHYNIGYSYEALEEYAAANVHYKNALALGLSYDDVEAYLMQNSAVIACESWLLGSKLPIQGAKSMGFREIAAVAHDTFFLVALESTLIRGLTLELFLTHLRSVLSRLVNGESPGVANADDEVSSVLYALAQQCFINEYVFAQTDEESQRADQLRGQLQEALLSESDISPFLLAAVAAYSPLSSLTAAKFLLTRSWPECAIRLLNQQVREPLEEADDRDAIPALTAIDNSISAVLKTQYEENPYPRWITRPLSVPATSFPRVGETAQSEEILIAGCGTGQHALEVARRHPNASILAIDLSRASLAYARRKTREASLHSIEYAQGDILHLGEIGTRFDRVEVVGVLHHLADPLIGLRTLLSLLRPSGIMRIGLYSETARRSVVEARKLIVERGYYPAPKDIRKLRQIIIRNRHERYWQILISSADDFYSMSGCRDLFFNVMEHRFTISQIAKMIKEQGLLFNGFELPDDIIENFLKQYPGDSSLANLDYWEAFEVANPHTFRNMYVFSVRPTRAPNNGSA